MRNPNLPITENLSISIEPDGNGCRLVIRLPWDSLEELLSGVVPFIAPIKRAKTIRQLQDAELKKAMAERRKATLALGQRLLDRTQELRRNGLTSPEAVKQAASEVELSIFDANVHLRIARKKLREERDLRIYKAVLAGKTNAQIAKKEGLASATVSRIYKIQKEKHGPRTAQGGGA